VAPPSLLTLIIDTSPAPWSQLAHSLPLHAVVQTLLVFVNAHLAVNHSNQVAVLASHVDCVEWLYPTTSTVSGRSEEPNGVSVAENASNQYRPFQMIEKAVKENLKRLMASTTESSPLLAPPLLSGALSTALAYANMQTLLAAPATNINDPAEDKLSAPGAADLDAHTSAFRSANSSVSLTSRILVISVSEADLSSQYIGLMNAVFAAQRMNVPIDMLRIGPRAAFLQQASDATNGVFITYDPNDINEPPTVNGDHNEDGDEEMDDEEAVEGAATVGLLQTLMMGFLPDGTARRSLVMPGSEEVDFRAACFCHGNVVDIGAVCSVCLSIFCLPFEFEHCPTCQSALRIPKSLSTKPAVLPKKKKKKRRDGLGTDTPGMASGANTPMRTVT
jgi:transcription initiation factor TFIIH subunit 3